MPSPELKPIYSPKSDSSCGYYTIDACGIRKGTVSGSHENLMLVPISSIRPTTTLWPGIPNVVEAHRLRAVLSTTAKAIPIG